MCDKAFNTHSSPKQFALQCFKTQQIFDKPVDYFLAALKFVPDWFIPTKMIRILSAAFYTVDNILYFNEDSANVVFPCNGMGIPNIDLNNINLDDTNLMKMTLILLILSDFWLVILNFKHAKHLKKG